MRLQGSFSASGQPVEIRQNSAGVPTAQQWRNVGLCCPPLLDKICTLNGGTKQFGIRSSPSKNITSDFLTQLYSPVLNRVEHRVDKECYVRFLDSFIFFSP